jgi:hypothetical protein
MKIRWHNDSFWDNEDKTRAKAIRIITDDEGRETNTVMTINKLNPDGSPNPDWDSLMEEVGVDTIDKFSEERLKRHEDERKAHEQQHTDRKNAELLEKLFNAKLEAFEIQDIKDSKNRDLKRRLRRAKSLTEVNLYAMMIVKESIENEQDAQEDQVEPE